MIGPLLRQEVEQTFHVIREKCAGDELVFLCPECDDKSGHRSLNLKSGLTFCWRCGKGKNDKGYFLAWARALGFEFTSSDEETGTAPLASLLERLYQPVRSPAPVWQVIELPVGFTPIAREPNGVYCKLITRMARRKNLDYDDFVDAGAGFTKQDPKWEPYCIFPVKEYGQVVYYQGRTYVDVPGETTKRFPSRNEVQYGASNWVYNFDAVRQQKPRTVVIVESILNVLSLKRKFKELGVNKLVPVSVFKHFVGKVQALKLLQCRGVKEFCFLFDRDALEQTWRILPTFSSRVRVSVAEMPYREDNPKLDPNDDVEAAVTALEHRRRYTAPTAFKHRIESALNIKLQ